MVSQISPPLAPRMHCGAATWARSSASSWPVSTARWALGHHLDPIRVQTPIQQQRSQHVPGRRRLTTLPAERFA